MIKILKYGDVSADDIFARVVPTVNVEGVVTEIIDNVRKNGDAALFAYCEKFDKAKLTKLLVSEEEFAEAMEQVPPEFLEILEKAAANIRKFHQRQVRNSFILNEDRGIVVGQKIIPLHRSDGLYPRQDRRCPPGGHGHTPQCPGQDQPRHFGRRPGGRH